MLLNGQPWTSINDYAKSIDWPYKPQKPNQRWRCITRRRMLRRPAGFFTGSRYLRANKYHTDTKNVLEHIPLTQVESLEQAKPEGATTVVIELVEGATPLPEFKHPENAFYVFGPEDGSVSKDVLTWCDEVVYVPTIGCMNLAATCNVVLYDRLAKLGGIESSDTTIFSSRDTNNSLKWQQQKER